jgi:hypothetical protein
MFETGDYIRWGAGNRSRLGMIVCRVEARRRPSEYGYKIAEVDDALRAKDSYIIQGAKPGAAAEYHWPLVSSLHPAGDLSLAESAWVPVLNTGRIAYKGAGASKLMAVLLAIPFLLVILTGSPGAVLFGIAGLAVLAGTVAISACYGVILEENDLRYGFLRRKRLAYRDMRQLDRLPGFPVRLLRVETAQGRKIFIAKSNAHYNDIAAQLRFRSGCLYKDI